MRGANGGAAVNSLNGDPRIEDTLGTLRDQQAEVDRLAPIAADLSPEAIALRKKLAGPPVELVARAKAIRSRRRRLGRNGYAEGTMAIPKGKRR